MPESTQTTELTPSAKPPEVRLRPMPPSVVGAPPEAGIGERLKYARSELSLSVEALARLTKQYDRHESKGVSATSLARYEGSDSLPGAREIRLLCEALAVSTQWLLLGELPNNGKSQAQQALIQAIQLLIRETQSDIDVGGGPISEHTQRWQAEQRARWLEEARKPPTP